MPPTPAATLPSLLGQAIGDAGRGWRLTLALYLPGALLACLTTVPVLLGLRSLAAAGPWTTAIAQGRYLDLLLEAIASASGESGAPPLAGFGLGLLGGVLLLLLALVGQWLAYAFLVGGVLERLAGRREEPYWSACRRWFGPMLRFSVLATLQFLLPALVGAVLLLQLPDLGADGVALRALIWLIWIGWVNGLLELGRADMVARQDRAVRRGAGRALALLASGNILPLALLLWTVLALLGAALWSAVGSLLFAPTDVPLALTLVVTLLVQQGALFAAAWLKLLRLAAALAIARAGRGA